MMKVTLPDGNIFSTNPVHNCTGYRASKLEMEHGDFYKLAQVVRNNPEQAYAILMQLDGRFDTSRKEPVQPSSYADLANYYAGVEFECDPVVAKRKILGVWSDEWTKYHEQMGAEPIPSFAQKRQTSFATMLDFGRFHHTIEQCITEVLKAVNNGESPSSYDVMCKGVIEHHEGGLVIYKWEGKPLLSLKPEFGSSDITLVIKPLYKKEG